MQDYDPFSGTDAMAFGPDRSLVIGQLGQSLDGRIATPTGDSKYISGACALDHLHRLRAAVDAVVVGVATALADDPLLNVRRVPGRHPVRVIIDPKGRVDPALRCLRDDGVRRLILRGTQSRAVAAPPGTQCLFLPLDADGRMAPADILACLRGEGLARILIEGGPQTLAAFIAADCVDRLHVVVSPVILGSGRTGLDLAPIATLSEARRPHAEVTVFPDGDVLFDCDLRRTARTEESHGPAPDHALCATG